MDRDDDIIITGKRHDFYSEYEVGYDELGVIEGLKIKLAAKATWNDWKQSEKMLRKHVWWLMRMRLGLRNILIVMFQN